ncbi:hypothetical protein ACIKP9_09610, partial [Methylobacillus methanolivorans]
NFASHHLVQRAAHFTDLFDPVKQFFLTFQNLLNSALLSQRAAHFTDLFKSVKENFHFFKLSCEPRRSSEVRILPTPDFRSSPFCHCYKIITTETS